MFALATGVGKTRLMGALIGYLYGSGQTNNCLILAPRTAVLEKLEREAQPGHPKYLFVDPALVPEPNLCFRSTIEAFRPAYDNRLNVFILSPQSITGADRRFARGSEFRGFSLVEYLKGLHDLVVFVDEAHHIGPSLGDDPAVWKTGIAELKPRIYFGLTATPRTDPGVNTIYTYDIATCLREGLYTKAVDLIVEERDPTVSDKDWDHYTIDFALTRLARKREAIREFSKTIQSFPPIEPVLLVCAEDTAHAEEIGRWLKEVRGVPESEILITHSERTRTEKDIQRLVEIDRPGNQVRIVVNVFQLTEGWDVTNVYVIAPLRAMASFRSAVQTMGRGLRLPAGSRTGNPDLDTLDVLCCGRESFEEILRQAVGDFATPDGGPGVGVKGKLDLIDEPPLPSKEVTILRSKVVEIGVPSVRPIREEPRLDFEIESLGNLTKGGATALHLENLERTGIEEGVAYEIQDFIASVHAKVFSELRFLSDPVHGDAVDRLIHLLLSAMSASADRPIAADPLRFALLVADEIRKRYKRQPIRFEVVKIEAISPDDYKWRVPETYTEAVDRVSVDKWRR